MNEELQKYISEYNFIDAYHYWQLNKEQYSEFLSFQKFEEILETVIVLFNNGDSIRNGILGEYFSILIDNAFQNVGFVMEKKHHKFISPTEIKHRLQLKNKNKRYVENTTEKYFYTKEQDEKKQQRKIEHAIQSQLENIIYTEKQEKRNKNKELKQTKKYKKESRFQVKSNNVSKRIYLKKGTPEWLEREAKKNEEILLKRQNKLLSKDNNKENIPKRTYIKKGTPEWFEREKNKKEISKNKRKYVKKDKIAENIIKQEKLKKYNEVKEKLELELKELKQYIRDSWDSEHDRNIYTIQYQFKKNDMDRLKEYKKTMFKESSEIDLENIKMDNLKKENIEIKSENEIVKSSDDDILIDDNIFYDNKNEIDSDEEEDRRITEEIQKYLVDPTKKSDFSESEYICEHEEYEPKPKRDSRWNYI